MKKYTILTLLAFALACTNSPISQTPQTTDPNPTSTAAPSTEAQAPEPQAPAAPTMPSGKLVSTDDPMSCIEFKDGKFIESYGKDVLGTYAYTYDPSCDNCKSAFQEGAGAGEQHQGCFLYTDNGETFCYIIYSMTSNQIEYSMIGGRGNTLRYARR